MIREQLDPMEDSIIRQCNAGILAVLVIQGKKKAKSELLREPDMVLFLVYITRRHR